VPNGRDVELSTSRNGLLTPVECEVRKSYERGLGVAGRAALWLTAPKARSSTAYVWLGLASAGIAGKF
jgi:hypothetical protein